MSSHDAPGDLATSSAGSLQKSLVQCSRVDKKQYIWTAQGSAGALKSLLAVLRGPLLTAIDPYRC